MSIERRNHYRILHVQPEAPAEVIKAAYRALMSTLRMHPDLGGDHATAARLNAAYQTLSDPQTRRAYDLSLKRPGRAAGAKGSADAGAKAAPSRAQAAVLSPVSWLADRRCPFCNTGFAGKPGIDLRCHVCEAPLNPAPHTGEHAELIGRRGSTRHARNWQGALRVPGIPGERPMALCDLSLTGLSLASTVPAAPGSALRVILPSFDAIVHVVACRAPGASRQGPLGHRIHGQLLTLQLARDSRGTFVSVRA